MIVTCGLGSPNLVTKGYGTSLFDAVAGVARKVVSGGRSALKKLKRLDKPFREIVVFAKLMILNERTVAKDVRGTKTGIVDTQKAISVSVSAVAPAVINEVSVYVERIK